MFMEVKLTETNGTNVVDASETRLNPTYIFYYTLSLVWHPTITTGNLYLLSLLVIGSVHLILESAGDFPFFKNSRQYWSLDNILFQEYSHSLLCLT